MCFLFDLTVKLPQEGSEPEGQLAPINTPSRLQVR
jgi:hypothetical protein